MISKAYGLAENVKFSAGAFFVLVIKDRWNCTYVNTEINKRTEISE